MTEMAKCFENPVFIAPLIRLLKNPQEHVSKQELVFKILGNLVCGNERVLTALATPACDTYFTLLRMLMKNKGGGAENRSKAQRTELVVALFKDIFECRRP